MVEFLKISVIVIVEFEKLNELFEECFDGGIVSIKKCGEKQLCVLVFFLSFEVGWIFMVYLFIFGKLLMFDIFLVFVIIFYVGLDVIKWKVFDIYFFCQGFFVIIDDFLIVYRIGNLILFKLFKEYINSIKIFCDYMRYLS